MNGTRFSFLVCYFYHGRQPSANFEIKERSEVRKITHPLRKTRIIYANCLFRKLLKGVIFDKKIFPSENHFQKYKLKKLKL